MNTRVEEIVIEEIVNKLQYLKETALELRDYANHDEYAKYGELYEAILEAEKVAVRNFGKEA